MSCVPVNQTPGPVAAIEHLFWTFRYSIVLHVCLKPGQKGEGIQIMLSCCIIGDNVQTQLRTQKASVLLMTHRNPCCTVAPHVVYTGCQVRGRASNNQSIRMKDDSPAFPSGRPHFDSGVRRLRGKITRRYQESVALEVSSSSYQRVSEAERRRRVCVCVWGRRIIGRRPW